ncbi:hypothetical protein TBLA_0C04330 [Henningerozyma blattae CBS 6284]|uniref:RRM domain-containing protein n=1 Tax=Henningerozyma blattae (strain ATCC 34711 / CBS 6284 / DSM 70876 / NBRC 10599 / NRRL Y-10934 / UCD 77-7) TaxID=1071380 RepID=I2H1H9_HENB6|nr:hypothetical protein TBLA_0C04330 [Tetrapisispora blattae CBS 6284]CCH60231.1 hypothetical protein TBLA_0C04330 [Tetrapisispora blattae CBS 6284]
MIKSADPRKRNTRHILTPANLSAAIHFTGLPNDWTQDTISSVVAGSGPIVSVQSKKDPRTGKLTGIVVEYTDSKTCQHGFELLNKIKHLPLKMEMIIPSKYKDTFLNGVKRPILDLQRDSYPWDSNLELPFEMVTQIPIPRKPISQPAQPSSSTPSSQIPAGNNTSGSASIPDILGKASKHLPAFQPNIITSPDQISQNLSKIPPLQVIEIISNLKILASQQGSNTRSQLEEFLKTNRELIVTLSQALLEMGFIDYSIVTQVLSRFPSQQLQSPQTMNAGLNMPNQMNRGMNMLMNPMAQQMNMQMNPQMNMNVNMGMNVNPMSVPPPPPMNMNMNMNIPPPFMMNQGQNMNQQPFGFNQSAMPPPPSFRPTQSQPQLQPKPQQAVSSNPNINLTKLQSLPQAQQDMIKQVLTLTDSQIGSLPPDQKTMVANLRKEYLL